MARFVDLVNADERGEKRFRKASDGRSLGVDFDSDGRPLIWIFEDGQRQRVLSKHEIIALLLDVEDDWSIANR